MEKMYHAIWIVPVLIGALSFWRIRVINKGWFRGYKQGQIDAMNGKVMYEKNTNSDGETSWEKIPNKWRKG